MIDGNSIQTLDRSMMLLLLSKSKMNLVYHKANKTVFDFKFR